jgi:hypothetical protein
VKQIELARQRLLGADGVPGVLSAGWEIFELVIAVAAASADQSADIFPAFTFARGSAVSGRNAITFAPSMPAGYAPSGPPNRLPATCIRSLTLWQGWRRP